MADTTAAEEKLLGAIEALSERAAEQAHHLDSEVAAKSAHQLAEALELVSRARDIGQGQATRDFNAGVEDLRDHRQPVERDDLDGDVVQVEHRLEEH